MGNKLDSLIFRPPSPSYSINDPHLHQIPTFNGNSIAAYYIKHRAARFTIIFSHGNAEDIGIVFNNLVSRLSGWNCNIFIYDYPGYGLSDGIPSEDNLYYYTDIAYKYLINTLKVDKSTVVAYGRSLGCACAVYLGVKYKLLGVILQSPFMSIYRIKINMSLPFDKFNNLDRAPYLNSPVLVIHGLKDEVIPSDHSRELLKKIPEAYYHFIEEGRHNDLDFDFSTILDSCLIEFFDVLMSKFASNNYPEYYTEEMINQIKTNNTPKLLTHVVNVRKDSSNSLKSEEESTAYQDADDTSEVSLLEDDSGKRKPNKCYFCLIF